MSYGSSCSSYFPGGWTAHQDFKITPLSDYLEWERKYRERLEEERKNDPKTVWGWAMKAFHK